MIRYTIDKVLEGHKDDNTFVKIFPSGWVGMHYVIEEIVDKSHFDVHLFNGDQIEEYLKNLKNGGIMNNTDMVYYLASIIKTNKDIIQKKV